LMMMGDEDNLAEVFISAVAMHRFLERETDPPIV
jgi:hypothetical protein